jgi:tRNA(Ile)-lysidine synthase
MEPWGLSGSKKVQDILVDQKVPRAERSRVPVFECGGTIVWLPGYRVARAWAVTDPEAVNLQISVDELGS